MEQQNNSKHIAQGNDDMAYADFTPNMYTQVIWNYLMDFIGNEYGVAGMMGNLYHESHCYPNMLYGDTAPPTSLSINYTSRVDNNEMSRASFISSRAYGLAQWLSSGRKANLYDGVWVTGGSPPSTSNSIGSLNRGLNMIKWELTEGGYGSTLSALQSASDTDYATERVFTLYEGAGDDTLGQRQHYALQIYDTYASGGVLHIATGVVGNGTISVSNPYPQAGETITLRCIPASGETLVDIEARIISSGQAVALSVTEIQQFPMPSESIYILATFTGVTPPPPIPTGITRRKMPIWMYPCLRRI